MRTSRNTDRYGIIQSFILSQMKDSACLKWHKSCKETPADKILDNYADIDDASADRNKRNDIH